MVVYNAGLSRSGVVLSSRFASPIALTHTSYSSYSSYSSYLGYSRTYKPAATSGNVTRAHDLTTFVSATGPGTQPQIIKKSTGGQKKDVQIKDAKGWAELSKGAKTNATMLQRDESDALWKEFKGKEQEQNDLKEQRKALEAEEARKKAAAKEEELRMRQEEDRKQREAAEAEARKKQEEEAQLKARQSMELEMMNKKAKEDAELDLMRQAAHGGDDHLEDLDIGAGGESDDEEEAMDI